jgi:hypothetical protein
LRSWIILDQRIRVIYSLENNGDVGTLEVFSGSIILKRLLHMAMALIRRFKLPLGMDAAELSQGWFGSQAQASRYT